MGVGGVDGRGEMIPLVGLAGGLWVRHHHRPAVRQHLSEHWAKMGQLPGELPEELKIEVVASQLMILAYGPAELTRYARRSLASLWGAGRYGW